MKGFEENNESGLAVSSGSGKSEQLNGSIAPTNGGKVSKRKKQAKAEQPANEQGVGAMNPVLVEANSVITAAAASADRASDLLADDLQAIAGSVVPMGLQKFNARMAGTQPRNFQSYFDAMFSGLIPDESTTD